MSWRENIAKKWMQLKIAERAEGLSGIMRQRDSVHRLVRKQQDGTLGQPDTGSEHMPEDDDTSVQVGDPTYNHYHGATPGPLPSRGRLSDLALAAILGGAAVTWLPGLINRPETPVDQPGAPEKAPVATDRVNEYELGISTGEAEEGD